MRKYLRNITVGAALLLLAGSCTDKFEEYNTNQYQIHDADPATLMKSMIETIVNIQQNDSQMQDQMVGQLGGYLCCSNTWSGTNFSTFNQSDAWNATPWNTPFEKYMETFSRYRKQLILPDIIMLFLYDTCHNDASRCRLLWTDALQPSKEG